MIAIRVLAKILAALMDHVETSSEVEIGISLHDLSRQHVQLAWRILQE